MRKWLVLAFLLLAPRPYATVHTTASCSYADVNSYAGNGAMSGSVADGDTVVISSTGSPCTWASTLTIIKAIVLKGSGCTFDANNRPQLNTCTRIVDGLSNGNLISLALKSNSTEANTRISQIQFEDGGTRSGSVVSPLAIYGQDTGGALDSRTFRFDHNYLKDLNVNGSATAVDLSTLIRGRVDHNYFDSPADHMGLYLRNPQSYAWADARWAAATNWGSNDFVFIETNYFKQPATADEAAVDAFCGARYVFRFNDGLNVWAEAHGSESGRCRGTRAIEVYKNNIDWDHTTFPYIVNLRSGTALTWGNIVTNNGNTGLIHYVQGRGLGNYNAFALSAGTNVWDINDGNNPQSICGGTTCTVASAGGTGAIHTVDVTSAGWTLNEWVGYHIKKVGCDDNNRACGGIITGNDSDTITFQTDDESWWDPNFAMGETFTVNLITHGMDMPCRTRGTMDAAVQAPNISMTNSGTTVTVTWNGHGFMTGEYVDFAEQEPSDFRGTYAITVTGTDTFTYTLPASPSGAVTYAGVGTHQNAAWNDQITDPCYQWLNTMDGSNVTGGPQLSALDMRANEHYFEYIAPGSFDGTAGVSSGARASRPASTTNGVAWWATDQGGDWWVGGGDSNDGCLDIVVSGAWSNCVYTPATYDPASLEESAGGGSSSGGHGLGRARGRVK